MLIRLFLLFVVVPLVELTLLLQLAKWTNVATTLLIVIVTGLIGSMLARAQGVATYRRIQQEMQSGRLPADSLFDGFLIFVAGALLITPGMLTDIFGLSLLLPPCRRFYRTLISRWFESRFNVKTFRTNREGSWEEVSATKPKIIDAYVVEDEKKKQTQEEEPRNDT